MNDSRRTFLKTAGGISAVATAGCATEGIKLAAADPAAQPAQPGTDFAYYVHVQDNNGGAPIQGADVHLEPRQSGLNPYDSVSNASGNANFTIAAGDAGYYDIEVFADDYNDDILLRKNISALTGSHTINLVHV